VRNRIDNPDPAHSKWSAYGSIYFTDEDADGRQQGSYVLRVSGKVDGVRLPKSLFYVSRVMQNEHPDIHIIGHWNYPAGTKKTMYVAASHCDQAELLLNVRWTPKIGQRGSLTETQENDQHVKEETSAQCGVENARRA
jgi:beta-galactosidase